MEKQQLPLKARVAVDKVLAGYRISEIFELQTSSGSSYYIKGTKDGDTRVYKAYASGSIREVSLTPLGQR
jgi:hypothetical protein